MATKVMTNPVGWFEIPATNLPRAKKFYNKVFGYKLTDEKMDNMEMSFFPMEEKAPGAAGTLIKGKGYKPSTEGTLIYISVDDIPMTLNKVRREGGTVLMDKTSIGEHGFYALFKDCEGNRMAIHSMK
jgi:predicted enzyme related to lactoylglutathione lyase